MDTPRAPAQKKSPMPLIIAAVAAIILGGLTGYMIKTQQTSSSKTVAVKTQQPKANAYGTKDTKLFPDSAEGKLREGGVDGEGTHHLERPGGETQYVYLTSSVIDLGTLEGKTVKVWGKTYAGNKAGWLMDVGYIEVK